MKKKGQMQWVGKALSSLGTFFSMPGMDNTSSRIAPLIGPMEKKAFV